MIQDGIADLSVLGRYYRDYEDMISDQEAASRRLIEFLGLQWHDDCLRYFDNKRSVTTPSRWQVRQPIYPSSVNRWKHYERHLAPLLDALGDLAD